MKNKKLCILLLTMLVTASCGDNDEEWQDTNNNANNTYLCTYANRLEFPKLRTDASNKVLVNKANGTFDKDGVNYCVEWDTKLMAQRWSCYQMHNGYKVNGISRYDGYPLYLFDPQLSDAEYFDGTDLYKGSGIDHGHICPSADRLYSVLANKQTFFLTNMQPQYHKFNEGLWKKLEEAIRGWCVKSGVKNMYVCKGATIDKPEYILNRIKGKLIVPKYFFCALLAETTMGYQAIGFWMVNEELNRSGDNLSQYAISIDELERLTDIDFFCNLPDRSEASAESRFSSEYWGF